MCLMRVTERFDPPREGEGYKVFCYFGNTLETSTRLEYVQLDTWMQSNNMRLAARNNENYSSGFHVFITKEAAERYRDPDDFVLKVQYRGAHTQGTHNSGDVIVAKEIFIPRGQEGLK